MKQLYRPGLATGAIINCRRQNKCLKDSGNAKFQITQHWRWTTQVLNIFKNPKYLKNLPYIGILKLHLSFPLSVVLLIIV